jgi:hypothetical protein
LAYEFHVLNVKRFLVQLIQHHDKEDGQGSGEVVSVLLTLVVDTNE